MENIGIIVVFFFGLETVRLLQPKCLAVTSLEDICSHSKACQARACCSAMSLSQMMNTLQEIMVLTGYIDYCKKSFGGVVLSFTSACLKLWKVSLENKKN